MNTPIFECAKQITRLNKLIYCLQADINSIRRETADIEGRIKENQQVLFRFPQSVMHKKLHIETNEMNRQVLKYRQKIAEYERKIARKVFLRESKLHLLNRFSLAKHRVTLPSGDDTFDWGMVLRRLN
jgi:hypothetical protein